MAPKKHTARTGLLLLLYAVAAVAAGAAALQYWQSGELLRTGLCGLIVITALLCPRPVYLTLVLAFGAVQAALHRPALADQSLLLTTVAAPMMALGLLGELVYQLNADRRRTEAVFTKSEERFSSIFDASGMAIAILDRSGRQVTTNHALTRMLARSERPVAEARFFELMEPEDARANETEFEALIEGRQNYYQRENRYRLRGQQLLWGRLSVSLVRNAQGQPEYAVAILEDVTARRLAEEALRRSEARFRSIFEGAAIGIALVNREGRVVESNPALHRMLGYSAEQLLSHPFAEFTYPPDARTDERQFQLLIRGATDYYQLEKRYVRRDGQVVWGRLTMSLLQGVEEEPQYAIGMVEDITERKRAEEALVETEQRYRSVVDNIKEVIFQTETDGVLTLLNPAWHAMTGFEVSESLGTNVLEYIDPDDRQFYLQSILPVVWRRSEWQRFKVRFLHRDGERRWVEVFYRLTQDVAGNSMGASGTMNDITERMREEAERRRLQEQRENMIATVSHELRAPIAAMILNFDLLADGTLGDLSEEQQQFVDSSINSILDLSKTVDDLLAVSRLHDGRVKLHLDGVDLAKLLGKVYERMLPRARSYHVLLDIDAEPGLPLVETDPQQLAHVLTELVENGIKYSGHGRAAGKVRVSAHEAPEGVVVEVSDNGRGIPGVEKAHIFEPFYRSATAMKDQVPGTGLGLNIVKQIAALLHVKIEVADTPGGGVTFVLRLPREFQQPRCPVPGVERRAARRDGRMSLNA